MESKSLSKKTSIAKHIKEQDYEHRNKTLFFNNKHSTFPTNNKRSFELVHAQYKRGSFVSC